MAVAVAAPVLALATGLAISAMGDAVVFFYTPGQARAKHVPPGRVVRIGGLVQPGSLTHGAGGETGFAVSDRVAVDRVVYAGALPDLFREGQGVVAQGVYRRDGVFEAREVLAKHDEKYMPKEVADALKKNGEWNGDGSPPAPPATNPVRLKP